MSSHAESVQRYVERKWDGGFRFRLCLTSLRSERGKGMRVHRMLIYAVVFVMAFCQVGEAFAKVKQGKLVLR